jgi:hypothetical protein
MILVTNLKKNVIIFFLFLFFLNCNSNFKKQLSSKQDNLCNIYFNKYSEKFVNGENDSALFYIDKAIKCNPNEINYYDNKLIFLISIKKYYNAIELIEDKQDNKDPIFKLLKGVLYLKINNNISDSLISESYNELLKKTNSDNLFYKIALDNYFKGKVYSLNEISIYRKRNNNNKNDRFNIDVLEDLIINNSKETVLFKIFK